MKEKEKFSKLTDEDKQKFYEMIYSDSPIEEIEYQLEMCKKIENDIQNGEPRALQMFDEKTRSINSDMIIFLEKILDKKRKAKSEDSDKKN